MHYKLLIFNVHNFCYTDYHIIWCLVISFFQLVTWCLQLFITLFGLDLQNLNQFYQHCLLICLSPLLKCLLSFGISSPDIFEIGIQDMARSSWVEITSIENNFVLKLLLYLRIYKETWEQACTHFTQSAPFFFSCLSCFSACRCLVISSKCVTSLLSHSIIKHTNDYYYLNLSSYMTQQCTFIYLFLSRKVLNFH